MLREKARRYGRVRDAAINHEGEIKAGSGINHERDQCQILSRFRPYPPRVRSANRVPTSIREIDVPLSSLRRLVSVSLALGRS